MPSCVVLPPGTCLCEPGHVLTPGAVQSAPATHVEPDVLVVPGDGTVPEKWLSVRERWLAVEISGRGSRVYDRDDKGPAYMRAGVLTYWRIDLRDRCLYVSTPGHAAELRHADEASWQPPAGPTTPFALNIQAGAAARCDWRRRVARRSLTIRASPPRRAHRAESRSTAAHGDTQNQATPFALRHPTPWRAQRPRCTSLPGW